MVDVFGNEIVSAFTGGAPVKTIYMYGEQVWPTWVPPSEYYLRWSPSNISGSFEVGGVSYRLEDYSGLFIMSEQLSYSFGGVDITYFETNTTNRTGTFYAFSNCKSLFSVKATDWSGTLATGTFMSCGSLHTVNFPKVTEIWDSCFEGCKSLQGVELPRCSKISASAFYQCYSMSFVSLPLCTEIRDYAFAYTRILSYVDLPKCSSIGDYAFREGTTGVLRGLTTLILRSNSVCKCFGNTFKETAIDSGTGSIYVPASLVSQYKSAQYWSKYSSQIFPIPN